MTRIYQVTTGLPDTKPGHCWNRFNLYAADFEEAVEKAKKLIGGVNRKGERILSLTLVAEAAV